MIDPIYSSMMRATFSKTIDPEIKSKSHTIVSNYISTILHKKVKLM